MQVEKALNCSKKVIVLDLGIYFSSSEDTKQELSWNKSREMYDNNICDPQRKIYR